MKKELVIKRFSEIATLINGRAYLMPELQASGKYRIIRVGNFSGKDEWFYSDMELADDKYCEKGDLLYKWACNFGPEIWEGERSIFHYHIWKVAPKKDIDKKYLYYYLKNITPFWLGATNGATMVHITKDSMERKKLLIPNSVEYQHRVADILSAYDNLIEVNNKRIKVLEQMAENLYKEWFVRFRFPGHETAEFENGIPKGWAYRKLNTLLDVRYGKDHKNLDDGSIPVFGSGGIMRFGNKSLYNGEAVLIPRKGSLNNIMYYNGPFWTVDTMFYSVPTIDHFAKYAYYTLASIDMESYNSGAALPSMTTDILYHFRLLVPDNRTLERFDKFVLDVFKQKETLKKANEKLIAQRDLLLPRLMSGKLEV